jgi:hypothetical protein
MRGLSVKGSPLLILNYYTCQLMQHEENVCNRRHSFRLRPKWELFKRIRAKICLRLKKL